MPRQDDTQDNENKGPLAGLRVVDFTHYVAGPIGSMLLADAGADVIKVEKPAGDDQRHIGLRDERLDGEGAAFLWNNRNKRSITLDLSTDAARLIAANLISTADIVIENFSSRVMEKFGLTYEILSKGNPRLIYCSVSAYGRTGASSARVGFDTIVQGESGFMSLTGHPDQDGVKAGPPVMDIATGMMASNAMLMALLARERTGRGQYVEVPLFDTAIFMTGFIAIQHLFSGKVPGRYGNDSSDSVPSGVFPTADLPIFLTCTNTPIFRRLFTQVVPSPELADDPALQVVPGRLARRAEITQCLSGAFKTMPRAHWMEKCAAAGVPAGEVRTLPEALNSVEARERGLVRQIPHATVGTVPDIGTPIYLSDTPLVAPQGAPKLGASTEDVMKQWLRMSPYEISAARQLGAFGKR
ncbi:MAG: CoA transferase [Devosia sp.]